MFDWENNPFCLKTSGRDCTLSRGKINHLSDLKGRFSFDSSDYPYNFVVWGEKHSNLCIFLIWKHIPPKPNFFGFRFLFSVSQPNPFVRSNSWRYIFRPNWRRALRNKKKIRLSCKNFVSHSHVQQFLVTGRLQGLRPQDT